MISSNPRSAVCDDDDDDDDDGDERVMMNDDGDGGDGGDDDDVRIMINEIAQLRRLSPFSPYKYTAA